MRSAGDRLRHTILYEVLLLSISIPLLSYFLHEPASKIGGMGVLFSLLAMVWNYAYNLFFDKALIRLGKPLYPRSFRLRSIHATLFEAGLMTVTIPAVMALMGYSFWKALAMDVGFLIMVPIYTLIYNWGYDVLFPVPARHCKSSVP